MSPTLPDLDTLFGIPNVFAWGGGFHLSPGGKSLVFMWNKTGRWQLYSLPIAGGEARQITYAEESVVSPRWSPDGKWIACLQDYAGDENFDLFVLDPATGETRNLTPDTPDEAINWAVRWMPDQSGFVYVSNRDGHFATYLLPAESSVPKRLTHYEFSDTFAQPSPDGRWIAVETMAADGKMGVFLVPLAGGEPIPIGDAASAIDASGARWSPDSSKLAFTSDAKDSCDVGIFDIATRTIEWLTGGAHECYYPVWSPDGKRLAYAENREGNLGLTIHALDGTIERHADMPGIHSQIEWTPDGRSLVFTYSGPDYPADLWLFSPFDPARRGVPSAPLRGSASSSGQARQLTDSLPRTIDRSVFVRPTHVTYPSLDEGVRVPALLYTPHGAKRGGSNPAVLFVHGGPTAQHDNDFLAAVQDLAMRGYVVLAPNYRGSTGYGRQWREANRFDIGRADTNDVAAGADYLAREGWAEPRRIGITGVSHGGYLTMTSLTFHPEKFAAGSALVPFVNWFTGHENSRGDLQYWDLQHMGDPVKDGKRWRAMSPIFFVDRIAAPVQLFAGAHDPRCPLDESEQIRDALRQRGRPVELHVYADEGHGFRKIENRVDAYKKRATFFDRYLRR
ncbi:MAG TPA: S9 family peptidase [Anaerolineae bacterium]|nr:S9 family peptidase [Anaerolineae bacterium]